MNIVLKRIRKRLKKTNQNFLGVICGQTGSGKSYSALTICKEIDPSFDIDRVTFTPEQFMELLNSGKLKKGKKSESCCQQGGVNNARWILYRRP